MIRIVFKPLKAPVVDHEGLYSARFNGREFFKVRARNAAHAEEKIMFLMAHETTGKVISFSLEQFKEKRHDGEGAVRIPEGGGELGQGVPDDHQRRGADPEPG